MKNTFDEICFISLSAFPNVYYDLYFKKYLLHRYFQEFK